MTKITELESKLIAELETRDADLDWWHFSADVEVDGIERHQMSGVIGSLIKKGLVRSDGHPTAPAIALTSVLREAGQDF